MAAGSTSHEWVRGHLYGVEKDYRLSRVSRIALFMHGAGDGEILFGDGLDNYPDKGVESGRFDVLVANPPYSVTSFKPYLKLHDNHLDVLEDISDNGSEIETCFVERAAQLVRPGGVAALILPPSILTTKTGGYPPARTKLLGNFDIRAIVQLGHGAFGATSTGTVVLFLRKFTEPPKRIDMAQDSVDAIFQSRDLSDWEDERMLHSYLMDRGSDEKAMLDFVLRTRHWREWSKESQFSAYSKDFSVSSLLKKLKKSKTYRKSDEKGREALEDDAFYKAYMPVEKDKVFHYSLVYGHKTLVVNSPESTSELKEFLGYEWSNGRGREGMRVTTPGGMLYPESEGQESPVVSRMVNACYQGEAPALTGAEELAGEYATSELIDFRQASFPKSMTVPRRIFRQRPWSKSTHVVALSSVASLADDSAGDCGPDDYVNTERMLSGKKGLGKAVPMAGNGRSYQRGDVLVSNIRPYLKKSG